MILTHVQHAILNYGREDEQSIGHTSVADMWDITRPRVTSLPAAWARKSRPLSHSSSGVANAPSSRSWTLLSKHSQERLE